LLTGSYKHHPTQISDEIAMTSPARSCFSISTVWSFPPAVPLDPHATNDIGDLPSTHAPYDPETFECQERVGIFMRVINVINRDPHPPVDIVKSFPQSNFEHEMVLWCSKSERDTNS
jgi:hypothetical protein